MSAITRPVSLADSTLDLFVGCLNEKSLQCLAGRELDPNVITRLDDLAEMANDGTFTDDWNAVNTVRSSS